MSQIDIVLKTAPGFYPYEEIDVTGKADLYEMSPVDADAKMTDDYGNQYRYQRGMKRRWRMDLTKITDSQVQILRRWLMNRQRITINGNYNGNTMFYQRFNRYRQTDYSPGYYIGKDPTFDRDVVSGTDVYASYMGKDGLIHLIDDDDLPRYEEPSQEALDWGLTGIRIDRLQTQYFDYSRPLSGALIWQLIGVGGDGGTGSGNEYWAWEADEPSNIYGIDGVGYFRGDTGDYIWAAKNPGSATYMSAFVWVRGAGAVKLVAEESGGDHDGATVSLDSVIWQQVKVEDIVNPGGSLKLRLECTSDSWMFVSCWQLSAYETCCSYIDNMDGSARNVEMDDLHYDVQIPYIAGTIYVGLRTPTPVVETGEFSPVIDVDQGSSLWFGLRYDATQSKWVFRKKTATYELAWTPARAGLDTIIGITWTKDILMAYEYSATAPVDIVPMTGGVYHTVPKGFTLGTPDDGNNTHGLNSQIYFVRVDRGFMDLDEMEILFNSYKDSDKRLFVKAFEGREFEIATPENKIEAAIHRNRFVLEEVYSNPTCTDESY